MFGIVSTGPSSIAIDLTYDRRRLAEAIKKISGAGLAPRTSSTPGAAGPPEVPHRAHVAFSTAQDMMRQLEQVHNRRKAFIYVSNGYDLDPSRRRAKNEAEHTAICAATVETTTAAQRHPVDPNDPTLRNPSNQFAFADLVSDLAEVTRSANRANTTIYTIDPRGPGRRPDLDEKIDMMELPGLRAQLAGQPARARGSHRRHGRREPERLHQGAQADRPGNERLLRGRLLEQSRSDEEAPVHRGQGEAAGRERLEPDGVYAETAGK